MADPARIPQTQRVILVRHAAPLADPEQPACTWRLSAEGRAAARRLAALALFDHATGFYAGPEPKARETLAPAAAEREHEVRSYDDLRESESGPWLGERDFLAAVRRFFARPQEPAAPGCEPGGAAAARFAARLEALRAEHPPAVYPGHALPGTFAIASGGRVLAAYLAQLLGYDAEQAFDLWQRLRLPDLAVIELPAGASPRLVIPFGTLGT